MSWITSWWDKVVAWFRKAKAEPKPAPVPVPAPTPTPTPTPEPSPIANSEWRGCLFTEPTPYENSNGAASQLGYYECHGKANENPKRVEMLKAVKSMNGNTIIYIRGSWWKNSPVLDMCLAGRKHPGDGHYFPIKEPLSAGTEVDWAMWAARDLGLTKHICFIWNDDKSMPVTEQTVAACVASYAGSRLGMENVAFGVCLETDEIMSADQAAEAVGWIRKYAHKSRVIVGSQSASFLQLVASKNRDAELWLEQAGHPINQPLTLDTAKAYISALDTLAAKVGANRVWAGEWFTKDVETRKSITKQIRAKGYNCGSGDYR